MPFELLQTFRFDALRFDCPPVSDIRADKDATAITRFHLSTASSLGVETLAAGVESEEQAKFLTSLGCLLLQGRLFGKAKPADGFSAQAADESRAAF